MKKNICGGLLALMLSGCATTIIPRTDIGCWNEISSNKKQDIKWFGNLEWAKDKDLEYSIIVMNDENFDITLEIMMGYVSYR